MLKVTEPAITKSLFFEKEENDMATTVFNIGGYC